MVHVTDRNGLLEEAADMFVYAFYARRDDSLSMARRRCLLFAAVNDHVPHNSNVSIESEQ
jgi:hypothetical protein